MKLRNLVGRLLQIGSPLVLKLTTIGRSMKENVVVTIEKRCEGITPVTYLISTIVILIVLALASWFYRLASHVI